VTLFATPVIMYGVGFTAGWKGSCVFSAMPTMNQIFHQGKGIVPVTVRTVE